LFAGAVTLNKFELATNLIFVEFFFVFRISILISLQKLLSRAIRDGLLVMDLLFLFLWHLDSAYCHPIHFQPRHSIKIPSLASRLPNKNCISSCCALLEFLLCLLPPDSKIKNAQPKNKHF